LREWSPCLEFTRIKDIALNQVKALVVIDTHAQGSMGVFGPLRDRKSVETVISGHN